MKLLDLTGKRFGKLVVIKRDTSFKKGVKWICKCDCGNETVKFANSLNRGSAISCGCHKFEDLTGKRFGKLVAKRLIVGSKKWLCHCDCGKNITVFPCNLKSGKTTSCGCFQKECASKRFKKHGLRTSKIYTVWANMKQRCYNNKNAYYHCYGGKGVKICEEWLKKFENFYDWSINNGYKEGLTIDRINVDGNYEPTNCKWATTKEQSLNTTRNVFLTYNGQTKTIYEWGMETGISNGTIRTRIKKLGWSVQRALTEKPFVGKNQSYKKEE